MAKTTILFGVILIALGVIGYAGGGGKAAPADSGSDTSSETTAEAPKKSMTALIPAIVGVLMLICGVLALDEKKLKHAMHGAAMIGLLGAVAWAGRGAMGLGKFFSGDPSLNQRSFLFVWLMAIICGIFVFLCVQSFIAARKRREQEGAA